jgi:hypothetical protein
MARMPPSICIFSASLGALPLATGWVAPAPRPRPPPPPAPAAAHAAVGLAQATSSAWPGHVNVISGRHTCHDKCDAPVKEQATPATEESVLADIDVISQGMAGSKSLLTEEARGLRRRPALTLLPTFTTSSPLASSPGL